MLVNSGFRVFSVKGSGPRDPNSTKVRWVVLIDFSERALWV